MDYRVTLIRSRRRTLALQVTPSLEVLVRAPLGCPKRDIDLFVAAHADWIASKLAAQRTRIEAHPPPDDAALDALRRKAKAYLPGRVAHYAARMGLTPGRLRITAARTRFGSCGPSGSLNFSCLLMQYPDEAIDYVVVHELAHLVHRNHGREFYKLVASVLPDYKARQQLLRD